MIPKSIPIRDVIDLAIKTIGTEMYRKYFKEGSIPVYLVGTITAFHISRTKFL